jgi:hypothetical protein
LIVTSQIIRRSVNRRGNNAGEPLQDKSNILGLTLDFDPELSPSDIPAHLADNTAGLLICH